MSVHKALPILFSSACLPRDSRTISGDHYTDTAHVLGKDGRTIRLWSSPTRFLMTMTYYLVLRVQKWMKPLRYLRHMIIQMQIIWPQIKKSIFPLAVLAWFNCPYLYQSSRTTRQLLQLKIDSIPGIYFLFGSDTSVVHVGTHSGTVVNPRSGASTVFLSVCW